MQAQQAQAERNKALKVAQYANPRKAGKETKAEVRLQARIKDWAQTVSDPKKVWTGYRKPGSLNVH